MIGFHQRFFEKEVSGGTIPSPNSSLELEMTRKIWYEEIPTAELEELADAYNTSKLERLRVNPPLMPPLIEKIKAIEGVRESDESGGATIITVSPTTILIEEWCGICGWELVKKIREALK